MLMIWATRIGYCWKKYLVCKVVKFNLNTPDRQQILAKLSYAFNRGINYWHLLKQVYPRDLNILTGKSFQKECAIIKLVFPNEAITYWKIILLVVNHSRCAISNRLKPRDYGLNNIYFCTYTLTKHWRSICLESCSNTLGWFFDCVQNFCCSWSSWMNQFLMYSYLLQYIERKSVCIP